MTTTKMIDYRKDFPNACLISHFEADGIDFVQMTLADFNKLLATPNVDILHTTMAAVLKP